jgi:tetratricopeptide (TPR) repeat protein
MARLRRSSDLSYDAQVRKAVEFHTLGRLVEAEQLYRTLLKHPQAQRPVLHFVLGLLLAEGGKVDAALFEYDLAAHHGRCSADLFERRGDLLRLSGRFADALKDYERAEALRPDHAPTIHHRAIALAAIGRLDEALEHYDRALVLAPGDGPMLNNRGVTLETLGRLVDAMASYDAAIGLDADYSTAHHNRGSALLKLERFQAASASFRKALVLAPERPETWNLLGVALGALSSHHEALITFERAIALRPAYAEALNNRAVALRWIGRFEDAVDSASRALNVDPRLSSALVSRGAALARMNRYQEALLDYAAALDLEPRLAPAVLNRGLAREALGDLDAALADFAEVERLAPKDPDARICMGLTYIRRGAVEPGFALYQSRWRKSRGPFLPHPSSTLWTGEEPIAGRTVLLYGEQGFGDVIQFCRFATDVARRGARVVLQVDPALTRLVKALAGPAEVLSLAEPPPSFDLHAPLMNLPAALGLSLRDIEGRGAYLQAPARAARAWKKRLGECDQPRVGLVWTGNPLHENDHNRSMRFDALSPLFETSTSFVSLQKAHRAEDARLMQMQPAIQRLDHNYVDLADVAAVIGHCDAVVAVDTAVAHLAGAMGKPVLILLPRFSDWRWMEGRDDSPWYPTARLLRQTSFGDWSAPVAAAAAFINTL